MAFEWPWEKKRRLEREAEELRIRQEEERREARRREEHRRRMQDDQDSMSLTNPGKLASPLNPLSPLWIVHSSASYDTPNTRSESVDTSSWHGSSHDSGSSSSSSYSSSDSGSSYSSSDSGGSSGGGGTD